jgi:hypothetical protein
MVTPKSVVETTPLVVARIEQQERARRSRERASAPVWLTPESRRLGNERPRSRRLA